MNQRWSLGAERALFWGVQSWVSRECGKSSAEALVGEFQHGPTYEGMIE